MFTTNLISSYYTLCHMKTTFQAMCVHFGVFTLSYVVCVPYIYKLHVGLYRITQADSSFTAILVCVLYYSAFFALYIAEVVYQIVKL